MFAALVMPSDVKGEKLHNICVLRKTFAAVVHRQPVSFFLSIARVDRVSKFTISLGVVSIFSMFALFLIKSHLITQCLTQILSHTSSRPNGERYGITDP